MGILKHCCDQVCPALCDATCRISPGSSVHGSFPGKTGVGCHVLLQGISLTQGSNLSLLCLLHWQAGSLPLSHPPRPKMTDRPHTPQVTSRGMSLWLRWAVPISLPSHFQSRWSFQKDPWWIQGSKFSKCLVCWFSSILMTVDWMFEFLKASSVEA